MMMFEAASQAVRAAAAWFAMGFSARLICSAQLIAQLIGLRMPRVIERRPVAESGEILHNRSTSERRRPPLAEEQGVIEHADHPIGAGGAHRL